MSEPSLPEIAKSICCPKRALRCAGRCEDAEETYFAAAAAVRELFRSMATDATGAHPPTQGER